MKIQSILSGLSLFLLSTLSTSVAKAESYKHQFDWLDANLLSKKTNLEWVQPSTREDYTYSNVSPEGTLLSREGLSQSDRHRQQNPNLLNNNFNSFNSLRLSAKTSFSGSILPQTPEEINSSSTPTTTRSNDYQTNVGALGTEPIIPETYLVQSTNVSQMRDITPDDWAYEALRSLVDNYNCIGGFPDQTFRGEQSLNRYEFAAGLNSCLQQIEQSIGERESVSQEDLQTIARLNQEFAAELQSLRGRVDTIDNRIGWLEDNQFSTTTVLNGEVIFALADAFGGGPPGGCTLIPEESSENVSGEDVVDCLDSGDGETNTVLAHLTRLGLQTSFTGKDRLRTYLTSGNFDNGGFTNIASLNTYMARLGYQAGLENKVVLDNLEYRFPAFDDQVVFYASTFGFALSNVLTSNSPYFDIGRGAVSRFGQLNPIYRIGGAMDAGVGFDWLIADPVRLQLAYGTRDSADPEKGFVGADHSTLGVQFLLQPTETIVTGITYVNAYSSDGSLGTYTGSVNAETTGLWSGGRLPDQLNAEGNPSANPGFGLELGDFPAQINAIGGSFQWRIMDNLTFASSAAYTLTNYLNEIPEFAGDTQGVAGKEAFGNTLTYLFSIGLSDPFGHEGDLFAFLFGMPPKLVDAGPVTRGQDVPFSEQVISQEEQITVTDNDPRSNPRTNDDGSPRPPGDGELFGKEDEATSLHFEFFYRYTVNDHISITPGFFFVTNPGHIEDNETLYVGTIRTTFRF